MRLGGRQTTPSMAELLQVTSLGCSVEAEHSSSAPLQPKGQGAGEADAAETMRGQ